MPTLDIDPLRSFVAVAAFSGVRNAAGALHLSPAAVTGHIRRLETELGTPLVVRQGRGLALTADGEELANRGRLLLEHHDETVRALLPPERGALVLAATEYAVETIVPAIVAALDAHAPEAPVRFRFTRSAWIREMFREARADISLVLTDPVSGGVDVGSLPLQWVGRPDAPRNRLVMYSLPCSVRHLAVPAAQGLQPTIVRECRDMTTLLQAVRAGEGIAALPRIGPLPDGLTHLQDMPPLPAVRLFIALGARLSPPVKRAVLEAARAAMP